LRTPVDEPALEKLDNLLAEFVTPGALGGQIVELGSCDSEASFNPLTKLAALVFCCGH
jgi:hypothetical protein